jgi:ribonuclease HI
MGPAEKVFVHFDGASIQVRGIPLAAWAFVIEGAGLDHEGKGRLDPSDMPESPEKPGMPPPTNNVAEYTAAIKALEYLHGQGYRGEVEVLGDSQLVVRQFSGEYAVKSVHLKCFNERLRALAKEFKSVTLTWVPREENQRADYLSKDALRG